MPCPPRFSHVAAMLSATALACTCSCAVAQNDWQYPDPYFGILEIEKSHDGGTMRRYRAEVNPAPKAPRLLPPDFWQPAPPAAATPQPAAKPRWRNRWRR